MQSDDQDDRDTNKVDKNQWYPREMKIQEGIEEEYIEAHESEKMEGHFVMQDLPVIILSSDKYAVKSWWLTGDCWAGGEYWGGEELNIYKEGMEG